MDPHSTGPGGQKRAKMKGKIQLKTDNYTYKV
jgi:hypothetical protein